jgi:hypothetical protein
MAQEYSSLEELHKRYPWKTFDHLNPLAKRHGFDKKEAKSFLENEVEGDHDELIRKRRKFKPSE